MEKTAKKQKPVSAILSLIFGILAYVPFINVIPPLFPILALAFGNRSIAKSLGAKMGKAGKLLGLIKLIIYAVFAFAAFLWLNLHWTTVTGWFNTLLGLA